MTNTITSNTAAASATSAATNTAATQDPKENALSSDFETFLKMLTVQMQNQDPLNPIEGADYAVQLATFSEVEQAVKSNDLLENLSSQLGLLGFSQLSGWVGMEARSEAPAYFDGENPVTLTAEFDAASDNSKLVVRDLDDEIVAEVPVDATEGKFEWDGKDADGQQMASGLYKLSVDNYYGTEKISTTAVQTYSRIVEARADGSDVVLVLEGGNEIGSGDVTALLDPE